MTGKELVMAAFQGQQTQRTPWVPFVGCHGGSLIGKAADEYLKSVDAIVEGQCMAVEKYQADGIPVVFDLQIEAEVLGCNLKWEKENPPAVRDHVLNNKEIHDLQLPDLSTGRIPLVFEATRRLRKRLPDTALYGLITGPFTLAMHLLGSNLFIKMYDDPQGLKDLMQFCREVGKLMIDGYLEAGCDIIAVVDPMTSQISPEHFREFVSPDCGHLFDYVRDKGALSSFFVCGDAMKNLEVMCACKPDNVSVDENLPLDVVKTVCLEHGVSFGGNLRLTTALLNGTPDANSVHAFECLSIGGNKGFILSPGCDLPYGVPVENIQAVSDVVVDEYKRQVAGELAKQTVEEEQAFLDLSDYGLTDKVVVDVITLDSEACAPCQYMVESVKEIMPEFKDLVMWREYKIKSKESVAFMTSLMVKNVPTICIDGKISFVSIIPTRNELIEAIQDRINAKLRIKIRRRQFKLVMIGDQCPESEQLWDNLNNAIKELGLDIDLERSDDENLARSYGARRLPAVITVTSQLKSTGRVPEVKIIREWLKDMM